MELQRFPNLYSRKVSDRIFYALYRLKNKLRKSKREEGWAICQLLHGIQKLEKNLNRLEARVAHLELEKGEE